MITQNELHRRYVIEKESPESIGKSIGKSGRHVRDLMQKYGIPRLGPAHLRKGKSATWNIGLVRSEECRTKNSQARIGKPPINKGKGSRLFCCEVCGSLEFDKPYMRKRTCGKWCKNVLMTISRGESHWNFQGGETSAGQRQRLWKDSISWRAGIIKHANRTCLKCGQIKKKMEAHHIKPWAKFPYQRFNPLNGACLCRECHREFHRIYGTKRATEADCLIWIKK